MRSSNMSSIKMTPPVFDIDLYRSSPRVANKAVKDFMSKFRGWSQATVISTKLGQGGPGETCLAWTCITDPEARHAYVGYPPAHGPGATAKSRTLNRSAQSLVHNTLMNSDLLQVIPSEFQTFDMEAYDDVDRAVDGEPCPVGTKIIECLEHMSIMSAYDIEARFDDLRAELKGFQPLKQKTHKAYLEIEDWFNNSTRAQSSRRVCSSAAHAEVSHS